jgi:hypothetical protein
MASKQIALEVQIVVDPATTAALAAAKQRLQAVPSGQEVEHLRATWASLQPAGLQDPAVATAAAAGMGTAAVRSVLEGWEAAGEVGSSFHTVLEQLGAREGWEQGWDHPRFFRKDFLVDGRKVAAGSLSYQFILPDRTALQGLLNTQTGKLQLPDSQEQYTVRYNELPVRVFSLAGVRGIEPQHWAKAMETAGVTVLAAAWALDQQQRPCRDVVKLVMAVTGSVPTAIEMPAPAGTGSFFVQLREATDAADVSAEALRKVAMTGLAREWVAGRHQQQLEEQLEQERVQREAREHAQQQAAAEAAAHRQQQRQRRAQSQPQQSQQQQQQQQEQALDQETAAAASDLQHQSAHTASAASKRLAPDQQQGLAHEEEAGQQQQRQRQDLPTKTPLQRSGSAQQLQELVPASTKAQQPPGAAAGACSSTDSGHNTNGGGSNSSSGSSRCAAGRTRGQHRHTPGCEPGATPPGNQVAAAKRPSAAAVGPDLKRQRVAQFQQVWARQQQQQQQQQQRQQQVRQQTQRRSRGQRQRPQQQNQLPLRLTRGRQRQLQQQGSAKPLPSIIPQDFEPLSSHHTGLSTPGGGSPQQWPAPPWAPQQQQQH